MKLKLEDVMKASGGTLLGDFNDLDAEIPSLVSHSQIIEQPGLFVPSHGEERDGHSFIQEALENGCIGCLTERELPEYNPRKIYVLVNDTTEAAWKIALAWRFSLKTKLICVTGSVGKTTTTGMIVSILRQRFSVFGTKNNCNDEPHVPKVVSLIQPSDQYAILELGMGMRSDVSKMAAMLRPDVMVITNVGYAHIQKYGSIEGTRDEKCETERGVAPGGCVVINGDDPLLRSYAYTHPIHTYGTERENDVRIDGRFDIKAKHLTYPTLAGVAVGRLVGMSDEEISAGIVDFEPETGRMEEIECDGFTLIDSAYNASPASMKVALDNLAEHEGKRIAVLGDMLELGEYATKCHMDVGSYITTERVDALVTVGLFACDIALGLRDARVSVVVCQQIQEGLDAVVGLINECKATGEKCVVLCKGSHGSMMYELANSLKNEAITGGRW